MATISSSQSSSSVIPSSSTSLSIDMKSISLPPRGLSINFLTSPISPSANNNNNNALYHSSNAPVSPNVNYSNALSSLSFEKRVTSGGAPSQLPNMAFRRGTSFGLDLFNNGDDPRLMQSNDNMYALPDIHHSLPLGDGQYPSFPSSPQFMSRAVSSSNKEYNPNSLSFEPVAMDSTHHKDLERHTSASHDFTSASTASSVLSFTSPVMQTSHIGHLISPPSSFSSPQPQQSHFPHHQLHQQYHHGVHHQTSAKVMPLPLTINTSSNTSSNSSSSSSSHHSSNNSTMSQRQSSGFTSHAANPFSPYSNEPNTASSTLEYPPYDSERVKSEDSSDDYSHDSHDELEFEFDFDEEHQQQHHQQQQQQQQQHYQHQQQQVHSNIHAYDENTQLQHRAVHRLTQSHRSSSHANANGQLDMDTKSALRQQLALHLQTKAPATNTRLHSSINDNNLRSPPAIAEPHSAAPRFAVVHSSEQLHSHSHSQPVSITASPLSSTQSTPTESPSMTPRTLARRLSVATLDSPVHSSRVTHTQSMISAKVGLGGVGIDIIGGAVTSSLSHDQGGYDEEDDNKIVIGRYTRAERRRKIQRFQEKKQRRVWTKKILYECRKTFADKRPRVGGRFVKMTPPATNRSLSDVSHYSHDLQQAS